MQWRSFSFYCTSRPHKHLPLSLAKYNDTYTQSSSACIPLRPQPLHISVISAFIWAIEHVTTRSPTHTNTPTAACTSLRKQTFLLLLLGGGDERNFYKYSLVVTTGTTPSSRHVSHICTSELALLLIASDDVELVAAAVFYKSGRTVVPRQ